MWAIWAKKYQLDILKENLSVLYFEGVDFKSYICF